MDNMYRADLVVAPSYASKPGLLCAPAVAACWLGSDAPTAPRVLAPVGRARQRVQVEVQDAAFTGRIGVFADHAMHSIPQGPRTSSPPV